MVGLANSWAFTSRGANWTCEWSWEEFGFVYIKSIIARLGLETTSQRTWPVALYIINENYGMLLSISPPFRGWKLIGIRVSYCQNWRLSLLDPKDLNFAGLHFSWDEFILEESNLWILKLVYEFLIAHIMTWKSRTKECSNPWYLLDAHDEITLLATRI